MQVGSQNNSINFTSVIPVRVYMNNVLCKDGDEILYGLRKFTKLAAGPAKNNPNTLNIMEKLGRHDPEYSPVLAKIGRLSGRVPSDFFACHIHTFYGNEKRGYLFTGHNTRELRVKGLTLTKAKKAWNDYEKHCEKYGLKIDYNLNTDVENAKIDYYSYIQRFVANSRTWIQQFLTPRREPYGKPMIMELKLNTNGTFGDKKFIGDVVDINFVPKE